MTYLETVSELVSRLNTDALREVLRDSQASRHPGEDDMVSDLLFEAACQQELANRGIHHGQ